MEWELLFGRLHPLIIHLPIGVFIIGFFIQVYSKFASNKSDEIRKILMLVYGASSFFGIISCITGLVISGEMRYDPDIQSIHKWMAIGTTILMIISTLVVKLRFNQSVKTLLVPGLVVLFITITGHFGGMLTHGKDHLSRYAPESVRWILGETEEMRIMPPDNPDSVLVYKDFVRPVLFNNCAICHNDEIKYGGFISTTYNDLFVANKGIMPVVKGSSRNSELFKRITLSEKDEKFMPIDGNALSYYEIKIIEYWIDQGADSLTIFEKDKMDVGLAAYMYEKYNLDFSDLPFYEKNIPDTLGQGILSKLESLGIHAKYLGQENFYLDVTIETDSISLPQLEGLQEVGQYVTFLDLSASKLTDEHLEIIGKLPNLTKLDLHGNPISSKGIGYLLKLEHLNSINLYKTKVDKKGIELLLEKPALKTVYLWESLVSREETTQMKEKYPMKNIVDGFTFDTSQIPVEKEESEDEK